MRYVASLARKADITRAFLGIAMVLGGTLVLALSAKVEVPMVPVPMTMQSLVVLLVGAAYGRTLGALTVLAYLAEGAAGMPVFASATAGPAILLGPTGGYLLGFVFAAYCTGWMAERGWLHGVWRAALGMLIGHVILFVPGIVWLASFVGEAKALALGLVPFLPSTVVKVALGASILALFRARLVAR